MAINKLPDARDLELLRTRMSTQFQIPSVYDDALSYQGLIYKLIQYLKDTMQNVEDWNIWLEDFVSTFDEKLGDSVKETVQAFIEDGSIQVIISEAIQWELDDYKSTNEQDKQDIIDKIATVKNLILLTPDMFEGNDLEKLQACLDYAIENKLTAIYLTRTYDITDLGSIMLPTGDFPFNVLCFYGGEIAKGDRGFVFDSLRTNTNMNAPQFHGTKFSGLGYLFNGDICIRQSVTNCVFYTMGFITTTKYLQTVRLINCESYNHGSDFIYAPVAYDLEILGHRGESSVFEYHLLHLVTEAKWGVCFIGLRITDCLFEGYATSPPIKIGTGHGLKINGVYAEANNKTFVFERGAGIDRMTGEVKNCSFIVGTGDCNIEFIGINDLNYLRFANITSDMTSPNTLFKGNNSGLNIDNVHMYGGAKISPVDVVKIRDITFPYTQQDLGANGISFQIPLQLKGQYSLKESSSKQFLFNAMFQYGSSELLSAHLTGILSIDGYYSGSGFVYGLNVDVLSTRNTSGNDSGNLENPVNFDYYFLETTTKEIPTHVLSATIVLFFPQGNYNPLVNFNDLSIKPLRSIVGEFLIDE